MLDKKENCKVKVVGKDIYERPIVETSDGRQWKIPHANNFNSIIEKEGCAYYETIITNEYGYISGGSGEYELMEETIESHNRRNEEIQRIKEEIKIYNSSCSCELYINVLEMRGYLRLSVSDGRREPTLRKIAKSNNWVNSEVVRI